MVSRFLVFIHMVGHCEIQSVTSARLFAAQRTLHVGVSIWRISWQSSNAPRADNLTIHALNPPNNHTARQGNASASVGGSGSKPSSSLILTTRTTRLGHSRHGITVIQTIGAIIASPIQSMSNVIAFCNRDEMPRSWPAPLQRWTCQILRFPCHLGFITSVWPPIQELQRWTSGRSKSECMPANACHASSLQRDDVIGKTEQTEYRMSQMRSMHPRVEFESWFSERT